MITFGSVCSGIEAASVAWAPLGWKAAWLAEIDKFPSAVLAHHYPATPNLGDMTKITTDTYANSTSIDLLVGGTPCQSYSISGLRKGLADPRGNLMLTYLGVADHFKPRWIVWENVPGVLSSGGGRDFGTFLGALGELGYGWAYRVLDAVHFGVPQRRRRVFVVGYLGDWRRAAAVLFERESLLGDSTKGRTKRQKATASTVCSVALRGREGGATAELGDDIAHALRASTGGGDKAHVMIHAQTAPTLSARTRGGGGLGTDFDLDGGLVAHTSRIMQPIAIQERAICENPNAGPDGSGVRTDGVAYTLEARSTPQAVAFDAQHSDIPKVAGTLKACKGSGGWSNSADHAAAGYMIPVAGMPNASEVQVAAQVRRLTPVECARLQGFSDNYLDITYRGKPAADGPKYKALGNSFAVPVVAWLGRRIQQVEDTAVRVPGGIAATPHGLKYIPRARRRQRPIEI